MHIQVPSLTWDSIGWWLLFPGALAAFNFGHLNGPCSQWTGDRQWVLSPHSPNPNIKWRVKNSFRCFLDQVYCFLDFFPGTICLVFASLELELVMLHGICHILTCSPSILHGSCYMLVLQISCGFLSASCGCHLGFLEGFIWDFFRVSFRAFI